MTPSPIRGKRALVISPLVAQGTVFGVLVVARQEAETFSSNECEFLRQLSDHVALATHQAQLYTTLQQAYDEHDTELVSLGVEPVFNPVRGDTRFQELLTHMKLPH